MILVIARAGIKFDNAVSTYVRRLAEGLLLNGVQTKVLLITQDYQWQKMPIHGVEYINSMSSKRRSAHRLVRGLVYYYSTYVGIWYTIAKYREKEEFLSLIHIGEYDTTRFFLMIACKLMGVGYYANVLEHPFRIKKTLSKTLINAMMPFLSNGLLCITGSLQTALPHKHSIVVPPTVESARLQRMPDFPDESSKFTIGYCGTISNYKDGFDILLASLRHVKGDLQRRIRLLVIGDSNRKEETLGSFERGVADSGMEIEVQFTGRIENSEVMNFLTDCNLLVLTRPDNLQTRYGFPSKLPEYLSTGRPVLVSKVSDIPVYLKDRVSAYLLDEVSPSTVAGKIEYIMQNYAEATEVGRRGYEVAKAVFNNEVQGRRVVEFCRNPQGVK